LNCLKVDQEKKKRIHITWNAAKTSHTTITDALNTHGYAATVLPEDETSTEFLINVSHIRVLLTNVHENNRDFISKQLCHDIDGLLSCRFMSVDNGQADLSFDTRRLDWFGLLSAIQQCGYPVQRIDTETETVTEIERAQAQIHIEGMHCNSCVSNICGAVEDLPGTFDIQLTFEDKVATIVYNPRVLKIAAIITEIENLGFKTVIANDHHIQSDKGLYITK
jgi:copper chaperone CopZ